MADLGEYRRKRDPGRTPEPVPADGPLPHGDNDVFVIQEHHARRLHYDVRLERDGVLVSWAVPKGLPEQGATIRLAVRTEDHPMEYAEFEGEIPKGEYGAGKMTIWDRGTYETVKWTEDEVQVVLHGERVDGAFVFFRDTRGAEDKNWMVRRTGTPAPPATAVTANVGGRLLKLTNLEKVLYPEAGFSKAEVIDYYRQVAPVLLPYLAHRPVTFKRFPDGTGMPGFFEKNVARHAPDWVPTVRLATPGSAKGAESADYPLLGDLPALIWAANLAAIELHVPQWTVLDGVRQVPDLLVFDLDPGEPATVVECCRVARRIQQVLAEDGITAYPKTSGGKGLQLYAPVTVTAPDQTAEYAKALARRLAREHPGDVLAVMTRERRRGKVFIDWSQNNPKKTTIAPYSLRARPEPTASTPLTWQEVHDCVAPGDLVFTAPDVLDRLDRLGDLFAGVRQDPVKLPG